MKTVFDIVIIGGGAAGFFTAINAAENDPGLSVAILERGSEVLSKVKVSGGGRCNVTHAEFDPKELVQNYPRGEKELLGPFHKFMTSDTIAWFHERGIPLKIEEDGRMFPVSDSSQTIIDCFLSEIKRLGIQLFTQQAVRNIEPIGESWNIISKSETFTAQKLVIATGSNPKIWHLLEKRGHTAVPPVPSLFTFNIDDSRIRDLPGISTQAKVEVLSENGNTVLESEGPLLITHWGMSGPAILKLSAWGARILHPTNYHFTIQVNWIPDWTYEDVQEEGRPLKLNLARQQVSKRPQFELPKRLWQSLVRASGISEEEKWADLSKNQWDSLSRELTQARFNVHGKSTFKEEFVTAGGIDLKEINFKTFESKVHKNLFFAGEVLNIDAITGGFNFQNAWTGGYLVARALTGT